MVHVLMEQAKRLALLETVVECSMSFGSIVPNLSCEQTRQKWSTFSPGTKIERIQADSIRSQLNTPRIQDSRFRCPENFALHLESWIQGVLDWVRFESV